MTPQFSFEFNPNLDNSKNDLPTPLPVEFSGRGEVKGFTFQQVKMANAVCIYEVSATFGDKWYEVFKIVIDRRFNRIAYPKSNAFGKTAWTARTLEKAFERFEEINWIQAPTEQ